MKLNQNKTYGGNSFFPISIYSIPSRFHISIKGFAFKLILFCLFALCLDISIRIAVIVRYTDMNSSYRWLFSCLQLIRIHAVYNSHLFQQAHHILTLCAVGLSLYMVNTMNQGRHHVAGIYNKRKDETISCIVQLCTSLD